MNDLRSAMSETASEVSTLRKRKLTAAAESTEGHRNEIWDTEPIETSVRTEGREWNIEPLLTRGELNEADRRLAKSEIAQWRQLNGPTERRLSKNLRDIRPPSDNVFTSRPDLMTVEERTRKSRQRDARNSKVKWGGSNRC